MRSNLSAARNFSRRQHKSLYLLPLNNSNQQPSEYLNDNLIENNVRSRRKIMKIFFAQNAYLHIDTQFSEKREKERVWKITNFPLLYCSPAYFYPFNQTYFIYYKRSQNFERNHFNVEKCNITVTITTTIKGKFRFLFYSCSFSSQHNNISVHG